MTWWRRPDGTPRWLYLTNLPWSVTLTLTWTGVWLGLILGDRPLDLWFKLVLSALMLTLILISAACAIYLLRHPEKRTYTLSAARREREAEERRRIAEAEAAERTL